MNSLRIYIHKREYMRPKHKRQSKIRDKHWNRMFKQHWLTFPLLCPLRHNHDITSKGEFPRITITSRNFNFNVGLVFTWYCA